MVEVERVKEVARDIEAHNTGAVAPGTIGDAVPLHPVPIAVSSLVGGGAVERAEVRNQTTRRRIGAKSNVARSTENEEEDDGAGAVVTLNTANCGAAGKIDYNYIMWGHSQKVQIQGARALEPNRTKTEIND